MATGTASRRSSAHRPRNCSTAGTVSSSADRLIRAVTAAAGLQPASIRAEPNVPEVPNVAADSRARARPAPGV